MPSAAQLLQRLNDLGAHLATRPDALALLGLGSAGEELYRLDEHSDLDFFVVMEEGAKQSYLDSIDWLEAVGPVAYSFANTSDGRKALYADGVFVEYAVFTAGELAGIGYCGGRTVWRRDTLGELPASQNAPSISDTVEHQLNEALTNLYVGMHRELRGERLTAARFIQQFAVDRVVTLLDLSAAEAGRDRYERSRRVELRHPELPLARMVPGYEHNRAAALAILEWLRSRYEVDPVIERAIVELL